jgi:hypothetical protein
MMGVEVIPSFELSTFTSVLLIYHFWDSRLDFMFTAPTIFHARLVTIARNGLIEVLYQHQDMKILQLALDSTKIAIG